MSLFPYVFLLYVVFLSLFPPPVASSHRSLFLSLVILHPLLSNPLNLSPVPNLHPPFFFMFLHSTHANFPPSFSFLSLLIYFFLAHFTRDSFLLLSHSPPPPLSPLSSRLLWLLAGWLSFVFSLSLTIFISHFILLSAFFSSLIYFPLFLPHYIFFFFPLLNSPPQFISFLIFPQTTISNIIPPFFHFFSIFFLFHFSLDLFSSLLPFFSSFTHDLPFLIFPSISSFHFSSFFSSTF